MKKLLALIFLSIVVFASAFKFDTQSVSNTSNETPKKELKIATFNVENLFDGQNNGNEYSDFKIGKSNWSNEKYLRKLDRLSSLLKELDADIIGLQEIENMQVLSNLAKKSGYKYYEFSKSKNSPFGVGVLSKIKIKNKEIYRVPNVKTRDILRVDFAVSGGEFSVFINHFPAAKNPLNERKAAARVLRNASKDVKNAILLGDFNTDFGSRSLLNEIINDGFIDLWSTISRVKRSSHIANRAIDHILLSESFFQNSYKKDSFKVFLSSKFYDRKNSISDHYPIYFTLNLSFDKGVQNIQTKSNLTQNSSEKSQLNSKANSTLNLSEIYGKSVTSPTLINSAVVTYKDKYGFSIAQSDGRGVYVFDRYSELGVGNMVDLVVYETDFYKNNFQISDFKITKIYDKVVDIAPYTLSQNKLAKARHGDVISSISGDVKDGKFSTKFGEVSIYGIKKKVQNGKNQTFKNAFVTVYKGQKEIVVR
ncbi:endonuclease/exonuclease/phosphatase family protein [Campylobacter geochelonis]|uniref:Putative endonuclease/exonuclease/phosphatase n=1 Tax=Campylobacter geochelonis TaxID=1780362 RepID=A0A128EJ21_9BACT|nr:endonuclease/exonuclease/phosphatase family protein [Campylobacter geochelonis]QKF71111.1 endonuclease/exonuclease/phosphatase [Campylobacter geochelonis]CZE48915.1 putative endonuclease/exonuclease/phosphatase [Campylobacter geochelonis]